MRRVIDTNVAIVANGRGTNASVDCRIASVDFLYSMLKSGTTILDLAGDIQSEYLRHLNPAGQPGVGDRFFQAILNSAPSRVERIDLPRDPITGEYRDFPDDPALRNFDRSDRKFVAAALRGNAIVANSTDSDWLHYKFELRANGVTVDFLCGCNPDSWIEEIAE